MAVDCRRRADYWSCARSSAAGIGRPTDGCLNLVAAAPSTRTRGSISLAARREAYQGLEEPPCHRPPLLPQRRSQPVPAVLTRRRYWLLWCVAALAMLLSVRGGVAGPGVHARCEQPRSVGQELLGAPAALDRPTNRQWYSGEIATSPDDNAS